jgi:hypothetical protein
MKALDLFCGLGGWSDGLAAEGFDVTGVEIEPKIAALYKHPVIVADICSLKPIDFKGYDLIVGSPPCRNFSQLALLFGKTRWKEKPDPEGKGMELVNAFLNFVKIAKPKYWCMENVIGLKKYLALTPRCESWFGMTMKRCLWGNFPSFLIPLDMNKKRMFYPRSSGWMKPVGKREIIQWERAVIPLPVARALGAAVKQALEEP